jgi:hypothetical protein
LLAPAASDDDVQAITVDRHAAPPVNHGTVWAVPPKRTGLRDPAASANHFETFRVHAALRVAAGRRERLEQVCRYGLRPAVAQDRVTVMADGRVLLALRHAWSDGTTQLEFDPVAFLERLAALVPRPRVNLLCVLRVLCG